MLAFGLAFVLPGNFAPPAQAETVEPDDAYLSNLPDQGMAPSFDDAVTWLNSRPLTQDDLKGKVVLVDFWTYSCVNCIRALPYVRAWSEKYKDQGLVVVGVHSPEFAFEKKLSNITAAVERFDINYPVAVDSDFKIWRSFRNMYWPAFYLIDGKGRLRYHRFGEGSYEETEDAIQALLRENGKGEPSEVAIPIEVTGEELQADLSDVRSTETYIGYGQASNFVSLGGFTRDQHKIYFVGSPALHEWGLAGGWTVGSEAAVLDEPSGEITIRFSARDLHLVVGPTSPDQPVRFQVFIDGKPPGNNHGADVDQDGRGIITQTRLYQLAREAGNVEEHTFAIKFLDAGARAYVFTFG